MGCESCEFKEVCEGQDFARMLDGTSLRSMNYLASLDVDNETKADLRGLIGLVFSRLYQTRYVGIFLEVKKETIMAKKGSCSLADVCVSFIQSQIVDAKGPKTPEIKSFLSGVDLAASLITVAESEDNGKFIDELKRRYQGENPGTALLDSIIDEIQENPQADTTYCFLVHQNGQSQEMNPLILLGMKFGTDVYQGLSITASRLPGYLPDKKAFASLT